MSTPAGPPATGRPAAFFDVDNTIIRGASAYQLGRALFDRGFFGIGDIMLFAMHQMRYQMCGENNSQISQIRSRALSIVQGKSVAEITAIGEEVYDEVLTHRIYPGTKALLDAHLAQGHEVWLITATPVEIGQLMAARIGATGALGTIAERADGFYTGRLVGDLLHGQAKADAVRELAAERGLDLSASFAYGDSVNDVAILSEVGNPCGINPDRRLRRFCAEKSWPVRDFRGRRRAVRRSVKAASWAGLAWAALIALRSLTARVRRRG